MQTKRLGFILAFNTLACDGPYVFQRKCPQFRIDFQKTGQYLWVLQRIDSY